jgi:hypothetical protein
MSVPWRSLIALPFEDWIVSGQVVPNEKPRLAKHQRGVHLGCLPPIPIQITNAIWAACLPYRFKLLMLFGLPATHTDFSYQC